MLLLYGKQRCLTLTLNMATDKTSNFNMIALLKWLAKERHTKQLLKQFLFIGIGE